MKKEEAQEILGKNNTNNKEEENMTKTAQKENVENVEEKTKDFKNIAGMKMKIKEEDKEDTQELTDLKDTPFVNGRRAKDRNGNNLEGWEFYTSKNETFKIGKVDYHSVKVVKSDKSHSEFSKYYGGMEGTTTNGNEVYAKFEKLNNDNEDIVPSSQQTRYMNSEMLYEFVELARAAIRKAEEIGMDF